MDAYLAEADRIYVVTLSAKLSGSYNSAVLAADLYREEHGERKYMCLIPSQQAAGRPSLC